MEEHKLEQISQHFKPKLISRNSVLVSAGQVCRELYYIKRGCLRTYYVTAAGHEKTRFITFDCSIGTALTSFIMQQPSVEVMDALEDSEVLAIGYEDFFLLLGQYPEWETFYRKILEMAYAYQNRRLENLATLSAGQRYAKLLQEAPMYAQRLSNKILASYLDVTQETLSRLKSG